MTNLKNFLRNDFNSDIGELIQLAEMETLKAPTALVAKEVPAETQGRQTEAIHTPWRKLPNGYWSGKPYGVNARGEKCSFSSDRMRITPAFFPQIRHIPDRHRPATPPLCNSPIPSSSSDEGPIAESSDTSALHTSGGGSSNLFSSENTSNNNGANLEVPLVPLV